MHSIIDRFFPIFYGTSNENHTTVLSQSNLTLRAGDKERFFCGAFATLFLLSEGGNRVLFSFWEVK